MAVVPSFGRSSCPPGRSAIDPWVRASTIDKRCGSLATYGFDAQNLHYVQRIAGYSCARAGLGVRRGGAAATTMEMAAIGTVIAGPLPKLVSASAAECTRSSRGSDTEGLGHAGYDIRPRINDPMVRAQTFGREAAAYLSTGRLLSGRHALPDHQRCPRRCSRRPGDRRLMTLADTTTLLTDEPGLLDTRVARTEVRHLRLPTGIQPFSLPDGRLTPTDIPISLIRVTDNDGVQGFSLLWFQHPIQALVVEAGLRLLSSEMKGYVLNDLEGIDCATRSATAFLGREGALAFATSGLRMAVEDLICRRRGDSLANLLGRKHDRVRAYQTGLMLHATIDELVDEAVAMYDMGVRAVKMLVGKPSIDEDADRIQAVRQSLPADTTLMVDALQCWTTATALRAAERFAEYGLRWIEDPLSHGDHAGYSELARRSPIPIATGETLFSRAHFDRLLAAGIPYIVGEPERVGGLCAWANIAQAVHQAGATMLPHLYPHVSAQLLATLPQDEIWLEYVPWFDSLVDNDLVLLDDGSIEVSSKPGAGFTPRQDAVECLASGPWRQLND